MAVFCEADDISVFGTGADEVCVGRDQVEELFLRNFSEATAHCFEWHWNHVSTMNDYAVVAAKLSIHLNAAGNALEVPVRWTVVLRRLNGHWVWLHRHASAAASGQSEGRAYPQNEY
jgi:hypothetical protein